MYEGNGCDVNLFFLFFTVYVDNNADLFVDPDRRTPFPGPLFQKDLTTYYVNADCTTVANLVMTEDSHTTAG